jgi:hypothetical protein
MRLLARAIIEEFGRDHKAEEFESAVDEWHSRVIEFAVKAPRFMHEWFRYYFENTHTVRGEAIASARIAADDDSLDEGLPDGVTSELNVLRLSRAFRWLNRYHGGNAFHLSCAKMCWILGETVKHNQQAGRIAHRLELAGLVNKLDPGTPFEAGLHINERRSAEWQWIGPW